MIDTHCHLDPEYFPEGADETLTRARSAGVTGFVCIGVGSLQQTRGGARAFAARRAGRLGNRRRAPARRAAACDAGSCEARARAILLTQLPRVKIAIGEIGLDFHYDHSPREQQKAVFRRFIQLAREQSKLPDCQAHAQRSPNGKRCKSVVTKSGARRRRVDPLL